MLYIESMHTVLVWCCLVIYQIVLVKYFSGANSSQKLERKHGVQLI